MNPPRTQRDRTPALTRRDLLRSTLALGLSRLPFGGLAGCGPASGPAAWSDLARLLSGELLLPSAMTFASAARPWNLRFADRAPGAIARCATPADVAACVQWATSRGVRVVARSGGHSYGAFSTPGADALSIDVSAMNAVRYDASTGRAELDGGARNTNVYNTVRPMNVALTHGRCYGVGVGGLVLGGGIGFNMRFHGLTCDQLVETDVVLANGTTVRCNERENGDLFWACRGAGGGNFGVHTRFVFQLYPVSPVAVFKITWRGMPEAVLARCVAAMHRAGDALGVKLSISASGSPSQLSTVLLGQLVGTVDEVRMLFADALAAAPTAEPPTLDVRPYWDAQDFLSEEGLPEAMHERSRYYSGAFSDAAMAVVLEKMRAFPGTSGSATWKIFLTGGQITRVAPDATAYAHRTATGLSTVELSWTASDSAARVAAAEQWLAEFHDALTPHTSRRSYVNFADPEQTDYLEAYYGENLARLVEVKRRYDPTNVFHYAQSIPTSLPPR